MDWRLHYALQAWTPKAKEKFLKQVKAIACGKKCNKYFAVNLSKLYKKGPAAALHELREKLSGELVKSARNLTDAKRSSLVFLGAGQSCTGLHLDWTEAYNRAFAVGDVDVSKPVAEWLFIAPSAIHEADKYLRDHVHEDGLMLESRIHLSGKDFKDFVAFMNQNGADRVRIVKQFAGTLVHVPPGWVHQVTNLQPCLKLAWDVYERANYGAYALLQQRIASPLFGTAMAPDYMALSAAIQVVLTLVPT